MMKCILAYNENPVPKEFTVETIEAKELRLRADIDEIDEVHILAPIKKLPASIKKSKLERKIVVHALFPFPYYLRVIPLTIQGVLLAQRLKPKTIEAESAFISGIAAIVTAKLINVPSIVEVRTTWKAMTPFRFKIVPNSFKAYLVERLERMIVRSADYIICNSAHYRRLFCEVNAKIVDINPGIQYPPIKKSSNKTNKIIGYLGRLTEEKGILLFLSAIQIVIKNHPIRDWQFRIAGDGVLKNEVRNFIEKNHLESCVKMVGFVNNFSFLEELSILVNPCLVDPALEMVNAEAAYCGVPVITFGNNVIPETVVDGVTGIKVKEKTTLALSNAIERLMSDSKLRSALSKNGPNFAKKNYAFTDQVNKLHKVYQELKVL